MSRIGIVSGVVAVLLISAVGCFNKQQGNAEAATTSGSSAGSAGDGQAAKASPAKATAMMTPWSGTHTEPVRDPGLGETAFTVTVPNGWKYVGMILRPKGCHAPAIPADGLSWTVVGPDGISAIGAMPGSMWMWESDGKNPMGPNCAPIDISSANAFLLNIAVPNTHPNATNIKVWPLTDKEQQGLAEAREAANSKQQYGIQVKHIIDFGKVRLEYNLNGHVVEEQMGVVLTCDETAQPAMPILHRPAMTRRNCYTHGTFFTRAPKDHMQEVAGGKLPPPQIDHKWDMDVSQRMQQAFAQMQAASDAQFRANQKHFQDQTNQMLANGRAFQANLQHQTNQAMAADAQRQNAIDHAAHQQVLDSLNRQDFVDPNTGRKIETSNQYNHSWVGSNGTVVLNSDPTYNPNGAINPVQESFTELVPVD